jgi:ferritin-like metal-binding protein YciE
MESTHERVIRYLDDAWAVEKSLVDKLRDMAEEVNDDRIRSLFEIPSSGRDLNGMEGRFL